MFNKIISFIVGVSLMVFIGCSLTSSSFDMCSAIGAAQAQQTSIEAAATTIIALHNTGTVTNDVYNKAEAAYQAWVTVQATLTSTLIIINDSKGNPSSITAQQYQQLAIQTAALLAEFIAVYTSISSTPVLNHDMRVAKISPCAGYTDAQITAALAPIPWSNLLAPVTK